MNILYTIYINLFFHRGYLILFNVTKMNYVVLVFFAKKCQVDSFTYAMRSDSRIKIS